MASKQFFDPITLLRLAPLVTSTSSILFSIDQHLFLNIFLAPQHSQKANEIVPSYFKVMFSRGIITIFTLYPLSIATGIGNFRNWPNSAWQWYAAGTAFAVAHFAFVPLIMWPVKDLHDDEPKGKGNKNLQKWLNIHTVRSVLVDFPAWVCFGIASLKSLKSV